MTTLNELTDDYIDLFIAKLKADIDTKSSSMPARSPPPLSPASTEKTADNQSSLLQKIDIVSLPWIIETTFY
ncbi:uncharacterized protein CELE_F42A9.17 [Caenorhabditis elegans]|uniref:Uncharacterized protein n=1 Tax=Caenorhabditis elegans TaxID=6239 RepID=U4PMB0_CAEEL|nr:Uncharacterized protein CELE_F42A9.17 [Caenorhabditis elegans]CDH93215.1 Uncharacterized protein CELE_F42A9.17 [Caenorhabditis elegans]|eukprot:NP_001294443.1 Uncharacterized protein CELE_F42A9.17 [Caenorhabditis elegans]